jgi:hypothetical protein
MEDGVAGHVWSLNEIATLSHRVFAALLQALIENLGNLFTGRREHPPVPLSSAIIAIILALAAMIYLVSKYSGPSK